MDHLDREHSKVVAIMQDSTLTTEQRETINRYLQTGDVDLIDCPWPGGFVKSRAHALRGVYPNRIHLLSLARGCW